MCSCAIMLFALDEAWWSNCFVDSKNVFHAEKHKDKSLVFSPLSKMFNCSASPQAKHHFYIFLHPLCHWLWFLPLPTVAIHNPFLSPPPFRYRSSFSWRPLHLSQTLLQSSFSLLLLHHLILPVTPKAVHLHRRRAGNLRWSCRLASSESDHHWREGEKDRGVWLSAYRPPSWLFKSSEETTQRSTVTEQSSLFSALLSCVWFCFVLIGICSAAHAKKWKVPEARLNNWFF